MGAAESLEADTFESISPSEFTHRTLPVVDKRVHRLGLACNYGIDAQGVRGAFERGVNYVLWTGRAKPVLEPVREALRANRERMVLAVLPTMGYFGGSIRRDCERALKLLQTDYLDVFHLGWLGVGSALTQGTIDALLALKAEKKIRAIGCSIHNRVRAGALAEDSAIDLFMIRYNAAHPGAEREVFPHLAKRNPGLVAYTATSWGKLLKTPRGWSERAPDAGDCYRFALSSPHVTLALTGPANAQQLDENLRALERGPLSADEQRWIRRFGAAAK